jgi:hypothetical protein
MGTEQSLQELLEKSRLDVLEKYSKYLKAEETLARQANGFFDKKYWEDFLLSKTQWQEAANNFYTLLHELAQ